MEHKLTALYGLKWNPFTNEIPLEALHLSSRAENFLWRIENALVREGGFALVQGDPGTGKSVVMRLLAQRLGRLADRAVASINHPQSNVADFYRELGDLFNLTLRPAQRWNSFKALRERWIDHLSNNRRRSILLIDEAQEMSPAVLGELRLMASRNFDSQMLLCVVLAGDNRLQDKLRREDLLPLGSRIRTRLTLEVATPEELRACLDHVLEAAGNAGIMTSELKQTLCDHALGNYRVLFGIANDLLLSAARNDLAQLDEKLFLQHTSAPTPRASKRAQR
jgi:type II secretory pathway predicted ATPase ExeA